MGFAWNPRKARKGSPDHRLVLGKRQRTPVGNPQNLGQKLGAGLTAGMLELELMSHIGSGILGDVGPYSRCECGRETEWEKRGRNCRGQGPMVKVGF